MTPLRLRWIPRFRGSTVVERNTRRRLATRAGAGFEVSERRDLLTIPPLPIIPSTGECISYSGPETR